MRVTAWAAASRTRPPAKTGISTRAAVSRSRSSCDTGRATTVSTNSGIRARFSSSEPGAHDETRFSGSLAFGVAVPLGARAAFRFEARGYLTVVDSDSAIFCRSDNGTGFCRVIASGSTVVQAEALAGIAIRF